MIVWGTYTVILISLEQVRSENPHVQLNDVEPWNYNINWAGGRTNWFDDINYTDLPLDQQLPEDLLAQLNNTLFIVSPANPGQLWRSTAYDSYDGAGWRKTLDLTTESVGVIPASSAVNEVYTISMNITVSANTDPIELPVLFPYILVIEDSFTSTPSDALISYYLEYDVYNTLLFYPFLSGNLGDTVLIQYQVTYLTQDLAYIEANAQEGITADRTTQDQYGRDATTTDLSDTVRNEIEPFRTIGTNAYDKAMAVDVYFRSNYQLLMGEDEINERPAADQEVTDWFIERGGGLPMDFATAYCVFMRELDIPARMTLGYALGDPNPDGSNSRLVRVLHMMFWAEVYIPFDGTDGEWIQVIPIPLPSDFGGGDLPENLDPANVTLYVGTPENIVLQWLYPGTPLIPQWSMIGDSFNLSAMLIVNDQPYTGSENIRFYDLTDGVELGTVPIEFTPDARHLPLANISYSFPDGANPGAHNISAMWITSTFLSTGFTSWVAVGQSNPYAPILPTSQFAPSETIDLNVKLGLTDYSAQWMDTLHVYGTMTIGGSPANGTKLAELGNDQMWLLWDGIWYGNATIGSDGYYELDIYLDPTDLARMTAGQHNVTAFYAGVYDPFTGIPVVLPGYSPDNIVTLSAVVGFTLSVNPTTTAGGGTITYDGYLYLLNGTILPGETVGIMFDGTIVDTAVTNGSGGFTYDYVVPLSQVEGDYPAQVNFTSGYSLVNGNTSLPVIITIESASATLTIDSTPKDPTPLYIYENITIFGTLTITSNSSPLVGRTVDLYWDWNNGTVQYLGSNITGAGGYYEFTYQIPAYSEGYGTYWVEFNSLEATLQSGISPTMSITVKRYDVQVYIQALQSSVAVGEELDIQGFLYLPELYGLLPNALVSLWWDNGSVFNIANVMTSPATGFYTFNYTIPLTHALQVNSLWANYSSISPLLYSNESMFLPINVRNYDSYLSISSNSSVVHLNETVYIYGYLEHENGTPLTGMLVNIQWNNGSVTVFPVYTNSTGWYNFYYNCSLSIDDEGTVTVTAIHTSIDLSYSSSSAILSPPLTLQLYQLTLATTVDPNPVHLDESFIFDGTLTLDINGNPVSGATIWVHYRYSNGTEYSIPRLTNSTGGFFFQYNCSLSDTLGAIYVWAQFNSGNPLWDDAMSLNHTVNLILYSMTLTAFTDKASYYLDEAIYIWGQLTYSHNSTPLDGHQVRVYVSNVYGPVYWTVVTNSSGHFEYTYPLSPSDEGPIDIWATFTTSVPLWDNATSSTVQVNAIKYDLTIDLMISPNPVYLNETITILLHLYFSHNSTDIPNEWVTVWWDNGVDSAFIVGVVQTNSSGYAEFTYSGMDDYTILVGNDLYAVSGGTTYFDYVTSNHVYLDLQRWSTLIHSLDTGGSTNFQLTDTVTVTGYLVYDGPEPDVPYSSIQVEILVDGEIVDTTLTASDGSFTGYWVIPDDTTTGTHVISARFSSSVNWIANYTLVPGISVDVTAINIIWTFSATPDPVYRGNWLYISGTLDLDNGSVYAGAIVTIYWQSPSQTIPSEIGTRITDGSGFFEMRYRVGDTAELGLTMILVDCSSGTPVIAYSGDSDTVSVEMIPVTLTGGGDISGVIYLGDTIQFSGTLTFGNGTSMVGYDVSIIWDGEVLTTITITDGVAGAFSYSYLLPWDESVQDITYYIQFDRPSEAYQEAQTVSTDLEIRDAVSIAIDTQSVTIIFRDDTLLITGIVTNGGGPDADVPLEILVDGAASGSYAITDQNGRFSASFLIHDAIDSGTRNFTVSLDSTNYDQSSSPAYWLVDVYLHSYITVNFQDLSDLMPGGSFNISFNIFDDDQNTPIGQFVSVYLNTTYIGDLLVTTAGYNTYLMDLDASWSGGSGYFVAIVEWDGDSFIEGSSGQTRYSIHVYDEVVFSGFQPGYAEVNAQVLLRGQLLDGAGNPIIGATVNLYLNTTPSPLGPSAVVITGETGEFTYTLPFRFTSAGSYFFVAEFVMQDGTPVTGRHDFLVTPGGPPGLDTALLFTWVIAIGLELIVAMIIVARYRYNRGGSGLFGFRLRSRASEIYDTLVR